MSNNTVFISQQNIKDLKLNTDLEKSILSLFCGEDIIDLNDFLYDLFVELNNFDHDTEEDYMKIVTALFNKQIELNNTIISLNSQNTHVNRSEIYE